MDEQAEVGESGEANEKPVVETALQEADRLINGDRRADYGGAEESFKAVADGWALIIGAPVTPTQVALCMVWLKVMREVAHDKRDNWVDMAGYAGLGAQLNQ